MPQDEQPPVIDLNRYRRAAAERTRAQARPQPNVQRPPSSEGLLGNRRHAGPILAVLVLAALALTFGPALLR